MHRRRVSRCANLMYCHNIASRSRYYNLGDKCAVGSHIDPQCWCDLADGVAARYQLYFRRRVYLGRLCFSIERSDKSRRQYYKSNLRCASVSRFRWQWYQHTVHNKWSEQLEHSCYLAAQQWPSSVRPLSISGLLWLLSVLIKIVLAS